MKCFHIVHEMKARNVFCA